MLYKNADTVPIFIMSIVKVLQNTQININMDAPVTLFLKVHGHELFFCIFCKNLILMIPKPDNEICI